MKFNHLNRFVFSLGFSLVLSTAVVSQDDIFGDDTGGGFDDAADATGGFGDTPAAADQEAIQQQMQQAMDGIRAQQEAGDWAGALEKINELSTQFGQLPLAFIYEAGRCHSGMGNDDVAIQTFGRILTAPNAFSQPAIMSATFVERGKLMLKGDNFPDAIDDFTEAIQNFPQNPDAHYNLGRAQLLQVITSPGRGRDQSGMAGLRSALRSVSKAIELNPEYGEAYLDRGRILLRLREMKFAIQDHEKAVQYMGDDSLAVADLALSHRSKGQQEASKKNAKSQDIISSYRKAIEGMDKYLAKNSIFESRKPWDKPDPLDIQAHSVLIARAETKLSLGDETSSPALYEDAIRDCDRFLALDHIGASEKSQAQYTRGVALRMLSRFDESVEALTEAITQSQQTLQPGYPEAYLRRGIIYFRQAKYDMAIDDFDEAAYGGLSLSADPRALFWKGLCLAKQGDFHAATRAYTEAITVYSDYIPAHMNRGLANMKTGRYKMAYDDFRTVMKLDPKHQLARSYAAMAKQQLDSRSVASF